MPRLIVYAAGEHVQSGGLCLKKQFFAWECTVLQPGYNVM